VGPVWHAVVGSAVCLTIAGAAMAQTQVVAPAAAPEAAEVPEAVGAWPERPGVTAAGETLRVGRGEVQDATTIRGRVTDEFGTGIGGARVQVYNLFAGSRDFPLQRMSDDCGTPPDCLTDREGGFALPIEAGTVCDLWIEKSGFAVAFCQSVSPGAAPLDVQMGRGARLTGVVRSRHGQRLVPASGETVRLSLAPRDGMWVGCVTERRTEADGSYAFGVSAPPEGRVWEVSFAGKAVAVGIRDGEQPDRVDFVVATEAEAKPAQAEAGAGRPGETTNTIGLELILVQPGRLTIPDRQAGGTKTLTVAAPFYLGKFEVTQAQWEQVMGSNPSRYSGPDRPVERVNWLDASEFCRRLSLLEKRTYRLPSADEWEYACRAGSTAEFCYGDDATTLGDYAWYGANSGKGVDGQGNAVDGSTRPVGQKKPNAWGFCDMQGNVNEWVAGEYDPPAQTRKQWSERSGRPADTPWRTYRGGCFFHDATACRCSWWTFYPQTDSSWVIGFRVALDVTATQGTE
jgi:formylglycine-generating enzyme required for sulfatase activity